MPLNFPPKIIKWNVDLKDCEYFLQILASNIAAAEVEKLILSAEYYSEEFTKLAAAR